MQLYQGADVSKVTSNSKYVDEDLFVRFEFYDYGHALEILHESFTVEWREIQESLRRLRLTIDDIVSPRGNERSIPKKIDDVLYPKGWREIRISGDLLVKKYPRQGALRRGNFADEPYETERLSKSTLTDIILTS